LRHVSTHPLVKHSEHYTTDHEDDDDLPAQWLNKVRCNTVELLVDGVCELELFETVRPVAVRDQK
jgi:hypothetical protein